MEVYDVLSLDGRALKHFKNFQHDPTAVITAINEHEGAFVYASPILKHDKGFVLHAISKNPHVFFYADAFHGDRDVVLAAVRKQGDLLRIASNVLKRDKGVVMAAVAKDGKALQWSKLRDDKEVVMTAVMNDGKALQWASDELRDDKDVVMAAVTNYGDALQWTYKRLKSDREVAMAAVMNHGPAFRWTAHVLKQDRELALTAVKHGCLLQEVSPEIHDPEMLAFARENEKLDPTQERIAVDFLREIKRQQDSLVTTLHGTKRTLHRLHDHGYHYGEKFKKLIGHFSSDMNKDLSVLAKRAGTRRTNRTSRVYK